VARASAREGKEVTNRVESLQPLSPCHMYSHIQSSIIVIPTDTSFDLLMDEINL
jgi:hypothetical protein